MADTPSEFPHDVLVDARDALTSATLWRLSAARWTHVTAVVDALGVALHGGNVGALRAAVDDLAFSGPVRATRIGGPSPVPPPEPVLEEINELITTIDGRGTAQD